MAKGKGANGPTKVDGAQIVGRLFEILRLVAESGRQGGRLKDIADASSISRPTVHRILQAMVEEHAIAQDPVTKRYHLGPLIFELGIAAPQYTNLLEVCRPTLERLAEETGDTIYLVMRSGFEALCIGREEGSFPIRTYTLAVGDRRPLGVGAAALALLAEFDASQLDNFFEHNATKLARYGGLTVDNVRAGVAKTHEVGYSISLEKLTKGVSGIGITIPAKAGNPYLGISIASITERIVGDRLPELHRILRRHVRELAKLLES